MNWTATEEAMKAIRDEQSQWLQQQNLRIAEQLDRLHQRMLTRMLDLLREGVDEEEDITKDDCCVEHHPLADAFQVFDESPKKNSHAMSDEWFGGSQMELPAIVSSDGGFSIPRRAAEEVVPLLDYYQQPPAQELVAMDSHDVAHGGSLRLANPSVNGLGFVAEQCLPFQELELSGGEGSYDGIKAIGQCCEMLQELKLRAHRMVGAWLAALPYYTNLKTLKLLSCENHGWKWAKSFSFISFDPGGMLFLPKWLLPDVYTIHKLEAVSVVFDPGKLRSPPYGGVRITMVGQSAPWAKLVVLWHAWLVEILAAIVRLVFDPGGCFAQPLQDLDQESCEKQNELAVTLSGNALIFQYKPQS